MLHKGSLATLRGVVEGTLLAGVPPRPRAGGGGQYGVEYSRNFCGISEKRPRCTRGRRVEGSIMYVIFTFRSEHVAEVIEALVDRPPPFHKSRASTDATPGLCLRRTRDTDASFRSGSTAAAADTGTSVSPTSRTAVPVIAATPRVTPSEDWDIDSEMDTSTTALIPSFAPPAVAGGIADDWRSILP